MCLQILERYGIIIHIYMRIWKKWININFSILYFTKQQSPTVVRMRWCSVRNVHANPLKPIVPLKHHFFNYLSIFLVYWDVSNSYKFKLVFHVSQEFTWHMNSVCNSLFVNCFFKSLLLYIYQNLKAYLLFGRNR